MRSMTKKELSEYLRKINERRLEMQKEIVILHGCFENLLPLLAIGLRLRLLSRLVTGDLVTTGLLSTNTGAISVFQGDRSRGNIFTDAADANAAVQIDNLAIGL